MGPAFPEIPVLLPGLLWGVLIATGSIFLIWGVSELVVWGKRVLDSHRGRTVNYRLSPHGLWQE